MIRFVMDRQKLNLNDLMAPWEREVAHPVHDPIRRSVFGVDVNIPEPASGKKVVGDSGPLAQDAFRASVIRQGGVSV